LSRNPKPSESGSKKGASARTAQDGPGIRLQVYLARSGVASRRACEQIVQEGRVTVNGRVELQKGAHIKPSDVVSVDGRKVRPIKTPVYVALNKPRGYLSSNADGLGRPLAVDLLKPVIPERLFHVGRLDFLSTGLILYTNDGDFARMVSHPSTGIEKEYLVEAARPIEDGFLKLYMKGIRVGDALYRCKDYRRQSDRTVRITLLEGKNRELRKVFASRNIRVKRIHRLRIGAVTVKGIAPGHFRRLSPKEVQWFFRHGSSD
jgi:23S rRNA pseudouridine2605 synthase